LGPAPAKPDPALTVEVTPEQATAISLTQSSGQNIDFLIRPRSEPRIAPGSAGTAGVLTAGGTTTGVVPVRVASTTRNRLAPYATRAKQTNQSTPSGAARAGAGESSRVRQVSSGGGRSNFAAPPSYPVPPLGGGNMSVPPASIPQMRTTEAAETYDIPVYGDGKLMRTDTVKKPQD